MKDLIVERKDADGARFALRVPYTIVDGAMVLDHIAALGAFEILKDASDQHRATIAAPKKKRRPYNKRSTSQ